MPLDYSIDHDRRRITIVWQPPIDAPQVLAVVERQAEDGGWTYGVLHDTRAGLRINARCQVVDMNGVVIAGLYCGGESAGGFSLHGLARCLQQGVTAGRTAHGESVPA